MNSIFATNILDVYKTSEPFDIIPNVINSSVDQEFIGILDEVTIDFIPTSINVNADYTFLEIFENVKYDSYSKRIDSKYYNNDASLIINEASSMVNPQERLVIDFVFNKASLYVNSNYCSVTTRESIKKSFNFDTVKLSVNEYPSTRISYANKDYIVVKDCTKTKAQIYDINSNPNSANAYVNDKKAEVFINGYNDRYELSKAVIGVNNLEADIITKVDSPSIVVAHVIPVKETCSYNATSINVSDSLKITKNFVPSLSRTFINVTGTTINPEPGDSYIPPNQEALNGLISINFRCQKNSYFEMNLLLGQPIIDAKELPSGVVFDGKKVKGSPSSAGKFTSKIITVDGSITDLVFEVDSLQRLL